MAAVVLAARHTCSTTASSNGQTDNGYPLAILGSAALPFVETIQQSAREAMIDSAL